jgi:PAS domain S-box-containing protein
MSMERIQAEARSGGDLEPAAAPVVSEVERRFQLMADAAPVLLWMSREDSMCTFFNQSWLDFTGRTLEQEWGVGWAEGVHPEDLSRSLDTYQDAFAARRAFEMEYRLMRADGEYRWILDRGVPRFTGQGVFAGFIGSCIDISERRAMETQLHQAIRAKDEFLGMVSHELRTPMAALVLQLERLRSDDQNLTDRQLEIVTRMGRTTTRLGELIESVLQFSRIDRGRIEVDVSAFDLQHVLSEIREEHRYAAEHKGLSLGLGSAPLAVLHSDPALVRLIVSNLVQNAIKFTRAGSVEIVASSDGRNHRVVVRDTGRGIASEHHARIFDPFEQLEPTRGKHTPGVGLGLSLAKAMSGALHGRIELESALGVGSTFTLVLPSLHPERS